MNSTENAAAADEISRSARNETVPHNSASRFARDFTCGNYNLASYRVWKIL